MKTFLKIIGVIFLLIVVYAVIAMAAFGKVYRYEKSMVMNAPAEKVWQQISSMKAFNQWNPWYEARSFHENYLYRKLGRSRRQILLGQQ
ncbi:hypothetical protein [Chryseobacterium taeanense]|uniref:hypothetical protein n=1 Tax=Chryseobacterium taeanense TaxID=311334 RepID=UPI0035B2B955